MRRSLFPILILLSSLIVAPAAIAAEGCYIGAHAGGAFASTGSAIAGLNDGGAVTSAKFGPTLGCDIAFGKTSAGLFVDLDFYRGTDGSPVFLGTSGAQLSHSVAVGVRPGYQITKDVLGYGTVGYSWTWADDLKVAGLHFDVPTFKGPFVGGGLEVACGSAKCALEYRATFNGDELVNLAPGTNLKLEPVEQAVTFAVKFPIGTRTAPLPRLAP